MDGRFRTGGREVRGAERAGRGRHIRVRCAGYLGECLKSVDKSHPTTAAVDNRRRRGELRITQGMNRTNENGLVVGDDGLARPVWASRSPLLQAYYDTEWGVPVVDEAGMFEAVALEVFVGGLSWGAVLSRREALRDAFDWFDPEVVANFTPERVDELLADPTVLRNRRKIEAVLADARATIRLRAEGGLAGLVWSHQPTTTPVPTTLDEVPRISPESCALSVELKAKGFELIGPVTAQALLAATGVIDLHVVGSHRRGCSGLWTKRGGRRRNPWREVA